MPIGCANIMAAENATIIRHCPSQVVAQNLRNGVTGHRCLRGGERQLWGMKSDCRRRGWVAAVGSVKWPSPARTAMSETRRLQTFPPLPRNGEIRQSWPTKTELPDRPGGLLV